MTKIKKLKIGHTYYDSDGDIYTVLGTYVDYNGELVYKLEFHMMCGEEVVKVDDRPEVFTEDIMLMPDLISEIKNFDEKLREL